MGYNISGIAVNKNLKTKIDSIENEIGYKLDFLAEVSFETASANWKEEGICDIYFGNNGTLIFLSHELSMESYSIIGLPTITFAISETSMAFCFHYCENGLIKRSRAEVEGQELPSEGEKLDIESSSVDTSEIIWQLIDKTIGQSFSSIDLSEKAYRYRLVKKENFVPPNNLEKKARIYKMIYTASIALIVLGLILSILTLTKIYDNRVGLLVIIFGVIIRRLTRWHLKRNLRKT
jgi:hypothetical protein